MLQLVRTNPGLIVWVLIALIAALVLSSVGMVMARSGASLRPVWWLAGLMLLIGAPQFGIHLSIALSALNREAPRVAAMQQLTTGATGDDAAKRSAVHLLFGPDADADLVVDARSLAGAALASAEVAAFASLPTGESVLLARFDGYSAAEKAWVDYIQATGLAYAGGKGDSQRGYAVTRPNGDRAFALHMSNMLGVWTGPDDGTIRQRMARTGFKVPRFAPLERGTVAVAEHASAPHLETSTSGIAGVGFGAIGLVAYLFVVVLYFFKGAAWAGSSPANPAVDAITVDALASRLENINTLDVPFSVERGDRPNEWTVSWRYAEAKWTDLARAHGMRRTHRIHLVLDESSHAVRATDYSAAHDWSAGRGGASFAWKASLGITFFHREHQRVLGLQIDEQGSFKTDLSYAYSFDLNEMKTPIIQAVTSAGWNWRPVVWHGPKSLQWLTE